MSGATSSTSTTSTILVMSAISTVYAVSTISTTSRDAQLLTAIYTLSESSTAAMITSQQSSTLIKTSTSGSMPLMTGNIQVAIGGAMLALVTAGI